jgi:hypothetical protein
MAVGSICLVLGQDFFYPTAIVGFQAWYWLDCVIDQQIQATPLIGFIQNRLQT